MTRDAQRRSAEAAVKVRQTGSVVGMSAMKRSETEDMLNRFSRRYNEVSDHRLDSVLVSLVVRFLVIL